MFSRNVLENGRKCFKEFPATKHFISTSGNKLAEILPICKDIIGLMNCVLVECEVSMCSLTATLNHVLASGYNR